MKRYFLLMATILLVLQNYGQDTRSALFIGNSYTSSNNLPQMVANMANAVGDTLIYDSRTPGGRRFLHHSADPLVFNKIKARNWDYVVLQGQSQEVAFDSIFFNRDIVPHARILADSIRSNYACSQTLFYTTWGRQNGDQINCQFLPWMCSYQGMDSALTANYTKLAFQNNAQMSPVGPVWNYIRSNLPTINLYASDGSHPSRAGTYAAACTFYTVIFKKDPSLISWNSTLTSSVADSIKKAAKRVVFDSLIKWNYSPTYPQASFTFSNTSNLVSFQIDTLSQIDSVHWDFGDGNSSMLFNPAHQYQSVGNYIVNLTVYNCGFKDIYTDSVPMIISQLDELEDLNKILLYPNPVQELLTLESTSDHFRNVSYRILNSAGQEVLNGAIKDRFTHLKINLSNGLYFIEIDHGNRTKRLKLLKQ